MTVKAGAVLDREAAPRLHARSQGLGRRHAGPVHDADPDHQPERPERQHAVDQQFGRDVGGRERAAGTLVGTVIAADLDATAPNNALTYTATGGSGFGAVRHRCRDRRGDGQGRRRARSRGGAGLHARHQGRGRRDARPVHDADADHQPERPERQHAVDQQLGRDVGGRERRRRHAGRHRRRRDLDATAPNNTHHLYGDRRHAGSACSRSTPRPAP